MEEKMEKEKSLTLLEFFSVVKRNLIWVIIIVIAFLCMGGAYAYLVKKTTYTATVGVYVRVDEIYENEDQDVAEYTKYQYSALLAPEFEKPIKSNEMQRKISEMCIKNDIDVVYVGGLAFNYTEESAFFTISYSVSQHGGNPEEIKKNLVNSLNMAVEESINVLDSEVDSDGKKTYGFLADKLVVYSKAEVQDVGVSTGRTTTIILAGLMGIIFACMLVVIVYFVDDRITTIEQAERISQQVVLSVVDLSPNFRTNNTNNDEEKTVKGVE